MKTQPVKGTHDIYGKDLLKYKFIEKTILELASIYDYNEIITPIFENTELFRKPLGEHSDVVLKEMYSFEDRNSKFLTLRPEYTTPIIRALISNNLLNRLPVKIFGYGPMFRRERPQKGRYRQFNQINFEIIGSNDYFADVELIILANEFVKKILSKKHFKLFINSLGDRKNIIKYKKILSDYFNKNKNKLSKDSFNKVISNPLRILDSKDKKDIDVCRRAPKIEELFSISTKRNFDKIQSMLLKSDVDFQIDKNLVRGLDYYCQTVFEFKSNFLGSQDTIIGGGRYDGLTKILGGPDIPGVGWACGIERLMILSNEIKDNPPLVHVIILEENTKEYGFDLINKLRKKKIKTTFDYKYNIKKSLKNANEKNSKFVIIVGDEELKKKKYSVKLLSDRDQKTLSLDQIFTLLTK